MTHAKARGEQEEHRKGGQNGQVWREGSTLLLPLLIRGFGIHHQVFGIPFILFIALFHLFN